MSRSTSDRSQQSHPNTSQNQQIQQVVRLQQSNQQQQHLSQSAGSLIVIGGAGNDVQRSILSKVNPLQNSILYSTPPSASAASSGNVGRNPIPTSSQNISTPTSHHDSSSPIAKKRLKLDTEAAQGTGGEDSIAVRRERVQKLKLQQSKALKER